MPRQKYKHKLEHYVTIYGCSFRTVQRYSKLGYPLDDVEATRNLIASQRTAPAVSSAYRATLPPPEPCGQRSSADGPSSRFDPSAVSLGLAGAIGRLQAAEATAHAAYLSALESGEQAKATSLHKLWLATAEHLRKVEQSAPDVAEQNKQAVQLGELQAALGELFNRLRQDLDTLPKRVARELVGKDAIGVEQVLKREAEEIILSLYGCTYLEGQGNE